MNLPEDCYPPTPEEQARCLKLGLYVWGVGKVISFKLLNYKPPKKDETDAENEAPAEQQHKE